MVELQPVASATELAALIYRRTAAFPDEEQYILVPVLRDIALSMIENVALGMARYHPRDRVQLLASAQKSLEELHSRLVLCRTTGLLSPADHDEIHGKYFELRDLIGAMVTELRRSSRGTPP